MENRRVANRHGSGRLGSAQDGSGGMRPRLAGRRRGLCYMDGHDYDHGARSGEGKIAKRTGARTPRTGPRFLHSLSRLDWRWVVVVSHVHLHVCVPVHVHVAVGSCRSVGRVWSEPVMGCLGIGAWCLVRSVSFLFLDRGPLRILGTTEREEPHSQCRGEGEQGPGPNAYLPRFASWLSLVRFRSRILSRDTCWIIAFADFGFGFGCKPALRISLLRFPTAIPDFPLTPFSASVAFPFVSSLALAPARSRQAQSAHIAPSAILSKPHDLSTSPPPPRSPMPPTATLSTSLNGQNPSPPAEVEATLSKLTAHRNVTGCLVLSRPDALVIRSGGAAFEPSGPGARERAERMRKVVKMVRETVEVVARQTEETEEGDELGFLRIRTKKYEMMISPSEFDPRPPALSFFPLSSSSLLLLLPLSLSSFEFSSLLRARLPLVSFCSRVWFFVALINCCTAFFSSTTSSLFPPYLLPPWRTTNLRSTIPGDKYLLVVLQVRASFMLLQSRR